MLVWILLGCVPVVIVCFMINARIDRRDAARRTPVFVSVHGRPAARTPVGPPGRRPVETARTTRRRA